MTLLEEHDLLYDKLLTIKKKSSKEYKTVLDEIIEIRIKYNKACGREMFQV